MNSARVMALDVGRIRIGVAITDGLGLTAQPLLTVWRKSRGEDLRSLTRLVRKHEVTHLVVGNPLHLSGEVGAWTRKVQEFAEELRVRSGLTVELWDERLSTVAAHEILNQAQYGTKNRKKMIDQVAAVVILEGWMQAQEQRAARLALDPTAAG
jgi:putative Holliday junction resolvase